MKLIGYDKRRYRIIQEKRNSQPQYNIMKSILKAEVAKSFDKIMRRHFEEKDAKYREKLEMSDRKKII